MGSFGGIPVPSAGKPGGSFGGVPVEAPVHQRYDQSTGSIVGDAVSGIGSGALGTIIGAYKLLRMVPGVGDKLPPPNDFIEGLTQSPDTMAGHAGKMAEQAAEFIIPATKVAELQKGASLVARMAGQASSAGTVRAVQTGGDLKQAADSAALGAAGPVVGAAAGAAGAAASKAAQLISSNPKLAKALPDLIGILSPRAGNVARVAGKLAGAITEDSPVAEKMAAATETAATQSADPLLDKIAAEGIFGKTYKSFKDAPANAQEVIKAVANGMRESPASAETFAAAPPETPAAAGASPPTASAPSLAEQLRDEMLANGSITPEHLQQPVPAPEPSVTPEGEQALAETMRNSPGASRLPIARATYAGGAVDDSELAGAVYEAAHRADRAGKLANALHQHGVSAEDVPNIAPEHWESLSKALGINPPSAKTIAETGAQLHQLENVRDMHAALDRLTESMKDKPPTGVK